MTTSVEIKGKLVEEDGATLAGATVRLSVLMSHGRFKTVGVEGVTARSGEFSMNAELPSLGEVMPRVALVCKRANQWLVLTESPLTHTKNRIDFGTVVVASEPVREVGRRTLYGRDPDGEFERDRLKSAVRDRQAEVDALKREVSEHARTADRLSKRAAQLEKELADKAAIIEVLESGRPVTSPARSSISEVLSTIGSELGAASTRLKDAGAAYRLGSVRMSLKTLPSGDGTSIRFPDSTELAAGEGFSRFDVDFIPGAGRTESAGRAVPDVVGSTYAFATRTLERSGFSVELSYRVVAEQAGHPRSAGRVIEQSPNAGTIHSAGTTVEILVGKPQKET